MTPVAMVDSADNTDVAAERVDEEAEDRPTSTGLDASRQTKTQPEGRLNSPGANERKLPGVAVSAFGTLPLCRQVRRNVLRRATKTKHQPQIMRLATVAMANRGTSPSVTVDPGGGRRGPAIGWSEATNARPPLRIDMEGPTACSYSPRSKPPYETNAPQWSFGRRTFVERDGGARTSWVKTWFQSSDVWNQKTDFFSDKRWPTPVQYEVDSPLRPAQSTNVRSPVHTIGVRRPLPHPASNGDVGPGPTQYDSGRSVALLYRRSPAYTHGARSHDTTLWQSSGDVYPGPGAYNPDFCRVHTRRPAYSIRGIRREKSHIYGPFATL